MAASCSHICTCAQNYSTSWSISNFFQHPPQYELTLWFTQLFFYWILIIRLLKVFLTKPHQAMIEARNNYKKFYSLYICRAAAIDITESAICNIDTAEHSYPITNSHFCHTLVYNINCKEVAWNDLVCIYIDSDILHLYNNFCCVVYHCLVSAIHVSFNL